MASRVQVLFNLRMREIKISRPLVSYLSQQVCVQKLSSRNECDLHENDM